MQIVSNNKAIYTMAAHNDPVLTVKQGEDFVLQAKDCYSNNLQSTKDVFTKEMWSTVNPATGPVFVEGAKSGQVLCVEIKDVKTRDFAVMCVEQGAGALGNYIEGVETSILPINDGNLQVNEKLGIPIRPMIGVIGTAPRGEEILNGTPGEHGGNMDCKVIVKGCKVHLPVNVEGGLLAAGDIHAVMGDGECCICGAEVSGEITLCSSSSDSKLPTPCVEDDSHYHMIGSALDLDECELIVLAKAHRFLTELQGMKPNEAARWLSLLADLRVCQVVDPLKTMRYSLPKKYLPKA